MAICASGEKLLQEATGIRCGRVCPVANLFWGQKVKGERHEAQKTLPAWVDELLVGVALLVDVTCIERSVSKYDRNNITRIIGASNNECYEIIVSGAFDDGVESTGD